MSNRCFSTLIFELPLQTKPDKSEHESRFFIGISKAVSRANINLGSDLLFKENISYGFRRNLWGMKNIAISIIFIFFFIHFYFITNCFKTLNYISPKETGLCLFFLASISIWLFVITKDWIKLVAFSYAERLFETLNEN